MTRTLQVKYAGAFYHVLNRGTAGEKILGQDKERLLCYVEDAAARYALRIHTYCLMSNHCHMIVETPAPNLSAAIQWLNICYAAWYNKKHDRRGHIFQGRFKSYLMASQKVRRRFWA